jgi:predicted transcriptional regulator
VSYLAERATKTEIIVKLLTDGKPRTVAKLSDGLGLRNLDSLLSNMWRRGHVLASKKILIYKPVKEDGSWRWSRGKQRWYTVANEPRAVREVAYETWDKRHGKVVEKKENLIFTTHEEANDTSAREGIGAKILGALKGSDVALFAEEIAGEINAGKGRAASALNYLLKKGKVKKAGWFNPLTGKEAVFDKGYLYFLTNEQYKQRLAKRNVLGGVKQAIYERIKLNAESQHRFTPHRELFSPRSKDATLIIRELQSVYQDLAKEEINGEPYYYVAEILTEKELEKEREY